MYTNTKFGSEYTEKLALSPFLGIFFPFLRNISKGSNVSIHPSILPSFTPPHRPMKDWLQNRGRSFVYSTALPVPVVTAAHEALRVSLEEPWRREHLWALVKRVGDGLGVRATSPIVPVIVRSEQNALRAMHHFLRNGVHVPAIRPPTVAPGTSRLRISLSAGHTVEDVDELVRLARALEMPLMSLEDAQGKTAAGGRVESLGARARL